MLRLIAGALTPLTFDEAYYWMWSKHLAFGYYDHPPMVALVIRLGTMIAGDTEFGVRLVSILLALPMSWAIYRTAAILFGGQRLAATAAIMLNVTLMAAVGTLIVTPDAPLLAASSFVLLFLAKVLETGRGGWWLAVGVAVGSALLSKYTALLFGPAILVWLVSVPKLRRWLISPWPYLGGAVALMIFAPVIVWNADHHWVSFIKQIGRARIEDFRPAFILELIPTQIAFATPLVWILGAMGLYALFKRNAGAFAARMLISSTFWIITIYFIWHSLHARVEANWFAPVYPAFAIAAAVAANLTPWEGPQQRVVDFCLGWALPFGILIFALLIVQANTGVLIGLSPGRHRAQRRRRLAGIGLGDRSGARAQRRHMRAGAGLRHHRLACLLSAQRYLRRAGDATHPLGQHARTRCGALPASCCLSTKRGRSEAGSEGCFARVERVAELERMRGPLTIETYGLDLLEGAKGEVLDRSPPPELQ